MATCPKCEHLITQVTIQETEVIGVPDSWHGISYVCPHCGSVLSVAIDPIAVKSDIVSEILDALGKG